MLASPTLLRSPNRHDTATGPSDWHSTSRHAAVPVGHAGFDWLALPPSLPSSPADARRAFRTTVLLAAVCVFNAFDLLLTQSQLMRGNFAEANRVAAVFADCPIQLTTYKTLLFGFGATVLFRFRHRRPAELGAGVLCVFYGALMLWWTLYIRTLEYCLSDPAAVAPVLAY